MVYLKALVRTYGGKPYTGYIEEERYRRYGSVYPLFTTSEALKIEGEINSIPDGHTKMDFMDGRFYYCDFAEGHVCQFDMRSVETNEGDFRLHEIGTYDWGWNLIRLLPVTKQTHLPLDDRKSRWRGLFGRRV